MKSEFDRRADQRSRNMAAIQNCVRERGDEPSTHGAARGTAHRSWMKFANIFRDNEKGAIESVENGESYLTNRIEDYLEDRDLNINGQRHLQQAHIELSQTANYFDRLDG